MASASGPLPYGSLSRDAVLDAALSLADDGGLEAVTMRRIGARLGASPMAVYRHIASRDELLDALVARAFETTGLQPDADAPWDTQLRQVFTAVHETLLRHPGLIAILASGPVSTERAMAAVESLLAALRAAGFTTSAAVAAVAALQSYTFGFTIQQRARSALDRCQHEAALQALPAGDYPHLHEVAGDFSSWATDEHFQAGLDWLLAGIGTSIAN